MSLVDRKSFFKILIIACFALVSISAAARKISIESVSLSATQHIPAHGLERGGTVLYISGSGFSANGKGITVYFGSSECNVIQQESTSTMVVCTIGQMANSKQQQNLPVTVYMVNSLPTSCFRSKCLFSYVNSLTSEMLSEQVRILAQELPVLKLTCTNATQYDNGGSECASCDGVENSPGTATTSRKACNCNPTFIWNATQQLCICPKNFILVNGGCVSCASVKTKNGNGLSNADNQCQCNNPTFTFNVQSFACLCTEANTFVNSTGFCFSCSDITTNGTGLVNSSSPKTCACKATFVWNPKVNDCVCATGSIYINQKCFSCLTLKGKNSTGALAGNLCQCNPTFVFSTDTNTCGCLADSESYIDKTSGGCVSCSNIGNSSNKANITFRTCSCDPTYIWNPAKSKTACLCPDNSFINEDNKCVTCTLLKGKNGTGKVVNSSSCQCLTSFVYNPTTHTCECPEAESYIDKATGRCVACTANANRTGFADKKARKCLCIDNTYIWTPTLTTPDCICQANSIFKTNVNDTKSCFTCTPLKGKNGTGKTNGTTECQCLPTFLYNPDKGACLCPDAENSVIDKVLGCISCAEIGNSTGNYNKTTNKCNCSESYIWFPSVNSSACLCPSNSIILQSTLCFSCSITKGKNGTGKVNSTDNKLCECLPTFVWSTTNNACECPDVNFYIDKTTKLCVSCDNTTFGNSTGQVNLKSGVCTCSDGFAYIPSIKKNGCVCPTNSYYDAATFGCVVCSGLKNKNGTGAVNKAKPTQCQCLKSFVYDAATNTCACPDLQSYIDPKTKLCVSCKNLLNGTKADVKADVAGKKCFCVHASLIWTPTLQVPDCICPPNSIFIDGVCISCTDKKKERNLTGLIFNSTMCGCVKSFVWDVGTNACKCPSVNSFIDKSTGACFACDGLANTLNTSDIVARKCNCLDSTYIWLPTAKPPKCSCPPNSIVIGGSCFLCTTLKGKNGTGVAFVNDTCACLKSFAWNPLTQTCQCPATNSFVDKSTGTCFTCNDVTNSPGTVNSTTNSSCSCNDTFVWDIKRSTTSCLCPTAAILLSGNTCFLCSTLSLPSATGRVNSTTKNTCECGRSYVFNTGTNVCECPDPENSYISVTKLCVSCSNLANSPSTVNSTKTGCTCNDGYTYNNALNKCLCVLPKREVDGTCVLPITSNSASASASCPNDMSWDTTLLICVCQSGYANLNSNCVNCSTISNSNGSTGADRTSCKCNTGFQWKSNSFSCN